MGVTTTLQRSLDLRQWETLATVPNASPELIVGREDAAGLNSFTLRDETPLNVQTHYFYRFQVDIDGAP